MDNDIISTRLFYGNHDEHEIHGATGQHCFYGYVNS